MDSAKAPTVVEASSISLDKQLQFETLKVMELEIGRDLEVCKLEQQLELKQLECEQERLRQEYEFATKKLELKVAETQAEPTYTFLLRPLAAPVFDVSRNICMVPSFSEKDVNRYLSLRGWQRPWNGPRRCGL